MPTKRAAAVLGARVAAGLLGVAIVVAAGGAAALATWPTLEQAPVSLVVSPIPAEVQRVCPGPLLTLAEDSSQASAATSVGSATAVYGAAEKGDRPGTIEPDVTEIEAVDNAQSERDGAPLLLSVPVREDAAAAPLVAGSQSQTAASETIAGLAVAACAETAGDAWLVGGSTDIGRTSLLLLSNPTTVVATVDLTITGETGAVDAPGSTGILVQPGSQRIISLAGLAPNVKSPVVHVQSRGGQIAATLEQSIIRGIEPGGVELLGPSTGPGLEQVIAGVQVTAPPTQDGVAAGEPPVQDEHSDDAPTVRILVPGDEAATVQVGATSEKGDGGGTSVQVELRPGIVTEVPLAGLTPGSYAVRLASDQPIVASARSGGTGSAGKDFAWYAASGTLSGDFMVSVAPGPSPSLHLANQDTADALLTLTPASGASLAVTVPAGQSAVLPLSPSTRYVVAGAPAVVASVSYAGEGHLSSFAVNPAGLLAAPIRVYLH